MTGTIQFAKKSFSLFSKVKVKVSDRNRVGFKSTDKCRAMAWVRGVVKTFGILPCVAFARHLANIFVRCTCKKPVVGYNYQFLF